VNIKDLVLTKGSQVGVLGIGDFCERQFVREHPLNAIKKEISTYLSNNPENDEAKQALQLLEEAEQTHYHSDAHEKLVQAYHIYSKLH
jgi:hypothetical protein